MKFEVLKRSHLKRNIFIGVIVVLIISAVVLNFTRAKYKFVDKMPLIRGTVNYSPFDITVTSKLLVGDTQTIDLEEIPTSSNISLMSATCTNDAILSWNAAKSGYQVSNLTSKDTKCEAIYALNNNAASQEFAYTGNIQTFKVQESGNYKIEAWGASGGNIGNYTGGKGAYTSGNIYLDKGDTLYIVVGGAGSNSINGGYNGGGSLDLEQPAYGSSGGGSTDIRTYKSNDNAWDNFDSLKSRIMVAAGGGGANNRGDAGYYWRIIRINGDGSIRLIYQGTSANTTGTGTQIGTSAFNKWYDESRYVGLVYGEINNIRGYGNNSTIMEKLNSWYQTNILNKDYLNYIDKSTGFCSDRNIGTIIEPGEYYYAAYNRLNNKEPSFKCDAEDILSANNGRLDNPIGLITADELMYGGVSGFSYENTENNYLYTGENYWTMSPAYFGSNNAHVTFMTGRYNHTHLISSLGVRPVINLKPETQFQAGTTGTSTNPYVVV